MFLFFFKGAFLKGFKGHFFRKGVLEVGGCLVFLVF